MQICLLNPKEKSVILLQVEKCWEHAGLFVPPFHLLDPTLPGIRADNPHPFLVFYLLKSLNYLCFCSFFRRADSLHISLPTLQNAKHQFCSKAMAKKVAQALEMHYKKAEKRKRIEQGEKEAAGGILDHTAGRVGPISNSSRITWLPAMFITATCYAF